MLGDLWGGLMGLFSGTRWSVSGGPDGTEWSASGGERSTEVWLLVILALVLGVWLGGRVRIINL